MSKREPTENRQRQIADAALKIIAAHGVGRLTTSAIAQEVGITEGAIFRHFDSKEGIVLAAIDRIEELLEQDAPTSGGTPLERLRRFVEHRVAVVHTHGGIPRLVFADELSFAAGDAGIAKVHAIRRRAAGTIRRCLEDAKREGELAEDVDIEAATLVVLGSLMVLVHEKMPKAVTSRVWATVERALRR